MSQQETIFRRTLRLPQDAAKFLTEQAKRNLTSENAEIVRSIRERMTAATGEGLGNHAPAAALNTSAQQGADTINQGI